MPIKSKVRINKICVRLALTYAVETRAENITKKNYPHSRDH